MRDMDVPDHLDYLLRQRYRDIAHLPLTYGRYSINRAPVAVIYPRDEYDLYGPRWGPSASVWRAGTVRPYVGIPLDENGFIVPNQPFYHVTSGCVLVVVPVQGIICPQVISEAFDPVNGERLGKVPNSCYKVEVLQRGAPVTGEVTTEQGAQKPSPAVPPPAPMNIWEWLKQPVHPKVPVPRGIVVAAAGIGIGYFILK